MQVELMAGVLGQMSVGAEGLVGPMQTNEELVAPMQALPAGAEPVLVGQTRELLGDARPRLVELIPKTSEGARRELIGMAWGAWSLGWWIGVVE